MMDFNRNYVCPDCGEISKGRNIKYPVWGKKHVTYVCPECGCIQDKNKVEQQLGKDE